MASSPLIHWLRPALKKPAARVAGVRYGDATSLQHLAGATFKARTANQSR